MLIRRALNKRQAKMEDNRDYLFQKKLKLKYMKYIKLKNSNKTCNL